MSSEKIPKDEATILNTNSAPLVPRGILDARFDFDELTPAIGREYPTIRIVEDLLGATDSHELLRDLAITISQRGVVFFRKQYSLTNEKQKELILRLGEVSGRPTSSTLHINPIIRDKTNFAATDDQISVISSTQRRQSNRKDESTYWHSDNMYETCTPDYTCLRLSKTPSTGGDTLWASGYDMYDRFSKPYQKFLEGLTATFAGDGILKAVEAGKVKLYDKPRGSPENVGLVNVHPVVRTNPVTGWKSIYALGGFPTCKGVNELDEEESKQLLDRFLGIVHNHELQVRFRWLNPNDFAIWDNRSVFHTATMDYTGERYGYRVVGIGEKPFFDPKSISKAEALLSQEQETSI